MDIFKLPLVDNSIYQSNDVVSLAKFFLGKYLITNIDNNITAGIIVETEAYKAPEDKASHAYDNRLTDRTKTMFMEGGVSYVYLIYGVNYMFNIVTGEAGIPHAILIRAIEPVFNTEKMMIRRKMDKLSVSLTNGPGKLSQALGINSLLNASKLTDKQSSVMILNTNKIITNDKIISSPRVGVGYAGLYKDMPWRFRIEGNPWIGK